MDVRLFLAVLRRFKWLTLGGFVLAVALAVLAYGSPALKNGKPTIVPRGAQNWQSQSEVLITGIAPKTGAAEVPVGDQSYTSNLAPVYAALANGDQVQALIRQAARVRGTVQAQPLLNGTTGFTLPFIDLTASAPTRGDAMVLASKAASTLASYVSQQETADSVGGANRVQLAVVSSGTTATEVGGHKLSTPLLVFVALLAATIGLAFVLENSYPRTAVALGRVPSQDRFALDHAVAPNTPEMAHLQAAPGIESEPSEVVDELDDDAVSSTAAGSRTEWDTLPPATGSGQVRRWRR
jgi:hypothetical protein